MSDEVALSVVVSLVKETRSLLVNLIEGVVGLDRMISVINSKFPDDHSLFTVFEREDTDNRMRRLKHVLGKLQDAEGK